MFVSTFAIPELCDFDALASLHLALDFGHDTDSTAQLLGAFVGAVDGADVFLVRVHWKIRCKYGCRNGTIKTIEDGLVEKG